MYEQLGSPVPQVRHQCVTETETAIQFQLLTRTSAWPDQHTEPKLSASSPITNVNIKQGCDRQIKFDCDANQFNDRHPGTVYTATWDVAILQVHGTHLET